MFWFSGLERSTCFVDPSRPESNEKLERLCVNNNFAYIIVNLAIDKNMFKWKQATFER